MTIPVELFCVATAWADDRKIKFGEIPTTYAASPEFQSSNRDRPSIYRRLEPDA